MDLEKQLPENSVYETGSQGTEEVSSKGPFLTKMYKLAEMFRAEIRGIERVPEEEKTETSMWTAASMWMGGNMVCATFALGALGVTTFDLNFWDSFLVIVFFTMLGALPVAYYSTFGPAFGLRQMVLSRFWFGYQGVRLIAFLNCIACIGWNAVNTMVSAQLLHQVNNGALPPAAGVVIIAVLTFLVSFFGYRVVHLFEMFAWIPTTIIFIIIAVRMGISGTFTSNPLASGPLEAASCLTFGGAVFGFATGWSSYAADYTVYMRSDVSRRKVFIWVWLGLCIPCWFAMILGAACATGTLSNESFKNQYLTGSVGGLFNAILVDNSLHGFGQFCIVILALSTIANNIPNMYSLGLSAQTVWSQFHKIPRFIWTFIGSGVSIAIAIPAYYHFAAFMQNFMNLIGYWLAIYSSVVLSEHFIWRRGRFASYDASRYTDKSYLPIGYAAVFGFCCGVAGAVVGMSQVWYVGPIARHIGDPAFGGDIGFPLGFAFAAIGFNASRYFELKYVGR